MDSITAASATHASTRHRAAPGLSPPVGSTRSAAGMARWSGRERALLAALVLSYAVVFPVHLMMRAGSLMTETGGAMTGWGSRGSAADEARTTLVSGGGSGGERGRGRAEDDKGADSWLPGAADSKTGTPGVVLPAGGGGGGGGGGNGGGRGGQGITLAFVLSTARLRLFLNPLELSHLIPHRRFMLAVELYK